MPASSSSGSPYDGTINDSYAVNGSSSAGSEQAVPAGAEHF